MNVSWCCLEENVARTGLLGKKNGCWSKKERKLLWAEEQERRRASHGGRRLRVWYLFWWSLRIGRQQAGNRQPPSA